MQSIPRRLLATNAAGAVSMPGNYIGVLLPKQHPATQQVGRGGRCDEAHAVRRITEQAALRVDSVAQQLR